MEDFLPDNPFRKNLIEDFAAAMNSVLGEKANSYDEQMKTRSGVRAQDLLTKEEMLEIVKRTEAYFFDKEGPISKLIKENKKLKEENKELRQKQTNKTKKR